jgi:hypothetical protein
MVDVALLLRFLAPALPFLLKVGDKAMDGAITKMGEDAWDRSKRIWDKLLPKVEKYAVAKDAVTKVAMEPDNLDRQIVLKMALQDLLKNHPELGQDLANLLRDEKSLPSIAVEINSTGNHNVNVGVNYGQM